MRLKTALMACIIPFFSLQNPAPVPVNPSLTIVSEQPPYIPRSMAVQRADAYREMYEFCGRHHNCINLTALGRPENNSAKVRLISETVKPFLHPVTYGKAAEFSR